MQYFLDTTTLGMQSLRLEVFDADDRLVSRASGFIVEDADGPHLYTCWHVVTGVDFLNPRPLQPPKQRKLIKVYSQDVQHRNDFVNVIGGSRCTDLYLYGANGEPAWKQAGETMPNPDLETIGLHVPSRLDLVRIPVQLPEAVKKVVAFGPQDIFSYMIPATTDVVVVGYPYGYSAKDSEAPEPIFLKRSVASHRRSEPFSVLLDGGGSPAMSGAPIITFNAGRWWLCGVYQGIVYPAARHMDGHNDKSEALGLMYWLWISRAYMGVE